MLITNKRAPLLESLNSDLDDAVSLQIAVGYVSPSGCEFLRLRELCKHIPVQLVVGRAGSDGLQEQTFKYLLELHRSATRQGGGVRVTEAPESFHSKVYCVKSNDDLVVFLGSSNLTHQGLQTGREANLRLTASSSPIADDIQAEAAELWENGTPVDQAEVSTFSSEDTDQPTALPELEDTESLCVDLVALHGSVPKKSGPNWWNGRGRQRDPNECYVPLRTRNLDAAERVFGSNSPRTPFQAVTHDGQRLEMRLEGSATRNGKRVAKNICTVDDKRIFGQWLLRDVLDLPERKLLTADFLENEWGRTEICFYRIGTNPRTDTPIIYVDFSRKHGDS